MPPLKEICPICLPQATKEQQDQIWYGLAKGGRSGAVEASGKLGIRLDEKAIRRHFEYHSPRQPKPRETWAASEALRRGATLTKRKRSILEIVFRLGAVDQSLIASTLYQKDPSKRASAEKAAARDLRQLLDDDYLFRIYADNMPGKNIWLEAMPAPVYFLGANGKAWAEKSLGFQANLKRDIIRSPEEASSWSRVLGIINPSRLLESFLNQLTDFEPPMARSGNIDGVHTLIDARNFFNYRFIAIKLNDPSHEVARLRSSGIGAATLYDSNWKPYLAPFIYHYDDGRRSVEKIISDVLSQQAMTRSGQVREISEQFHGSQIIPTLVVSKNLARFKKISSEAQIYNKKIMPGFKALLTHGEVLDKTLEDKVWFSLFDRKQPPTTLVPELIEAYKRHPIQSDRLEMIGSRKKT